MNGAHVAQLLRQQLLTGHGLDDDVQSSQGGEGLSQEIAVLHQLRLGHVGETDKHLLVVRIGQLNRHIAIGPCIQLHQLLYFT